MSNTVEAFQKAKAATSKWKDPEFGADQSSIVWQPFSKYGWSHRIRYKDVVWKRPSEMNGGYSKNPSLFGKYGKPIPNGVDQHGLGDCWLLAANAALAEDAERATRIIDNKHYDQNGAFRFYFWVKDAWYGINIDDRLPS